MDLHDKSTDEVNIIWLANLKKLKQPELFIELASRFQDLKTVKFIMVGCPGVGKWQSNLDSRIKQLTNLSYIGGVTQEKANEYLEDLISL